VSHELVDLVLLVGREGEDATVNARFGAPLHNALIDIPEKDADGSWLPRDLNRRRRVGVEVGVDSDVDAGMLSSCRSASTRVYDLEVFSAGVGLCRLVSGVVAAKLAADRSILGSRRMS